MMKKVILISGGSDGLGKAIAKTLAPDNQVVILSPNQQKLSQVSQEVGCDFVVGDVSDYDSVNQAVKTVLDRYQQINVLINNAGIWMEGDLTECDPQKIHDLILVNTLGTINLTKAVLPSMKQVKRGRIINIISQDGLYSKKDRSVYTASKWAITGFTKCLEKDLASDGISVTGVYPGLLNTGLFEKQRVKRDLSFSLEPSEVGSLIKYVINLSDTVQMPEVGIKNINNPNPMDDNNTPQISLDINPDLITPQTGIPQATELNPANNPIVSQPASDVIDITPGAPSQPTSDISAIPITPATSSLEPIMPPTPIVAGPSLNTSSNSQPASDVIDITPGAPEPTPATSSSPVTSSTIIDSGTAGSHLSDLLPSPSETQPGSPQTISVAPNTPSQSDLSASTTSASTEISTSTPTNTQPSAVEVELPPANRSQLFEDPDQVSLGKS